MATPESIQTVRVLIADLNEAAYLFTDEQITTYLTLTGDNPRLAAADALEAIAVSEVLISKKIKSQHLDTDGPAVAKALRELAATQRQIAADEDREDVFDIVDTITPRCRPELTEHPYGYQVWGL